MIKLKTLLAVSALAGSAMLATQQAHAWGNWGPFSGSGPWNNGWGGAPWNGGGWGGGPWNSGGPWNRGGWGGGPWNSGPWNNGGWGGGGPWGNGPAPWGRGPGAWANPADPKGSMARGWEDMLNAPNRMGTMPGGWKAPTVSVPNPVDVADELGDAMQDMPNQINNFRN